MFESDDIRVLKDRLLRLERVLDLHDVRLKYFKNELDVLVRLVRQIGEEVGLKIDFCCCSEDCKGYKVSKKK